MSQTNPDFAMCFGIVCLVGLFPFAQAAESTKGDCSGHLESTVPLLSLESPGLPGLAEGATGQQAMFGRSIAVGDFNGDDADDLVIAHGQSGELDLVGARGSVLVLPGSAGGPSVNATIRLVSEGLQPDPPRAFGESLAVADFNGDGFDDLVIGAFGLGDPVAGKVYVYYGDIDGINPLTVQVWDRDVGTIPGVAGDEDGFGVKLVAGHFDGDIYADLAILTLKGFEFPAKSGGVLHVLFGDEPGLTAEGNVGLQYIGAGGSAVGISLRNSIDTNSDGIEEIVVSPVFSVGLSAPYACLVHDLRAAKPAWSCFGSSSGDVNSGLYDPGAFAVGDFDGNGHDEIVSGENRHSQSPPILSGRVLRWLPQGDAVGIVEPEVQVIAPVFFPSYVDVGRFGSNLVAEDLDVDGFSDLIVGEPGWSDVSVPANSGRLHVYAGTPGGIEPLAFQIFNATDAADVLEPQGNLKLGNSMVAGDFNGDGCKDLVLAIPGRDASGLMNTGGVLLLENASTVLFRDGFDP